MERQTLASRQTSCQGVQTSCGSARHQTSAVPHSGPAHVCYRSSKVEFNLAAIPQQLCRDKPVKDASGVQEAAVPAAGAEATGMLSAQVSGNTSVSFPQEARPASSIACHRPPHPVTHCAGSPASTSLRCTPIRSAMPVREHPCTPPHRLPALTPLGRPGPGRGGRLPTAQCRSLPAAGSLRSPVRCPVKARHPHRARPPPRPRSTSFRAIGGLETLSRKGLPHQRLQTTNAFKETPASAGVLMET